MLCNVGQRLQSLRMVASLQRSPLATQMQRQLLADPGMAALLSALARGFELGQPEAPLG